MGRLAFSNSTRYFEYEYWTNGIYLLVTSHHGSWTYNSMCVISIMDSYSTVTKLDSGESFNEYISITIEDSNHRIAITNSGAATLHCALYQLLKIARE